MSKIKVNEISKHDASEITINDTIKVDTISEKTSANGVTIDGVLIKDNAVNTDTISEKTSAAGVTIDGVLIKDGISHSGIVQIVDNFDEGQTTASGSSTYVTTTTLDTITPIRASSKFYVTAAGTAALRGSSQGSSFTIMYKVNSGSYQHWNLDTSSASGHLQGYDNSSSDKWEAMTLTNYGAITYNLGDTITFAVHIIGRGPGGDGTTSSIWGHISSPDNSRNHMTVMEIAL